MRALVHAFKYGGRLDLLDPLGRRMADSARLGAAARRLLGAVVVHVPARASSLRLRGYDQADLLARGLARGLGRPHERRALMRRREPADAQAGRSIRRRRGQVRGAFRASAVCVAGRPVLLVDDVLSTGATADAASRALLLAGATEVTVLVLAT